MASTVNPNTFRVNIKEEHIVGGQRTVHENFYRIPNVTNYDRRIVTVPSETNVDLINTNGLTPGPALFPSYSIAYGRITNMDDSNRLAISFTSSNGESESGNVGSDLSGSYSSGGINGTRGTYSNIPTTTKTVLHRCWSNSHFIERSNLLSGITTLDCLFTAFNWSNLFI